MLITSHLQEARGETLATTKVPGQRLLQVNEPTSDDNDKKVDMTLLFRVEHGAVKLREIAE